MPIYMLICAIESMFSYYICVMEGAGTNGFDNEAFEEAVTINMDGFWTWEEN